MSSDPVSRRDFLATLGLASAAGFLDAEDACAVDPARDLKPNGANMGTLFPDVHKLAEGNRYAYSFLGDRFSELDDFKKAGRDKTFEVMLYKPEKVDPKPEVLEKVDCGTHTREKILFSTSPHFRVPAYVLVPKGLKKPAPAIVDLHSHGGWFLFGKEKVHDLGKDNHPVMVEYHRRNYDGRPTANELAKRGYVVISIDAFMFGERRAMIDRDLKQGWDRDKYSVETARALNQVCRGKESTLVKSLIFAGLTWPGIVFWDDIRTVDYLVTRPEVDPKRIGCQGISMGGYRTLFLAGLDERIAAANVVGFMSTVEPMIKAHIDTHSWVHFLPTLHRYLDWPDVVSMMAPKPLMVQQCEKDGLFPLQGMRDSLTNISKVYEKAGVKDRFTGKFYDAPHMYNKQMQDEAFAWFDSHLKPRT